MQRVVTIAVVIFAVTALVLTVVLVHYNSHSNETKNATGGAEASILKQTASKLRTFFATAHANRVSLWSSENGLEATRIYEKTYKESGGIHSISINADFTTMACGCQSGRVLLLNPADGSLREQLFPHKDDVLSVAFSADGKKLVSASADRIIKVFDISDRQSSFALTGDTPAVNLANLGSDVDRSQSSFVLAGHTSAVNSVTLGYDVARPGEAMVVSGGDDKTVRVWSAAGELRRMLTSEPVLSVAVSPDNMRIVSGGGDGKITVWDASSGELLFTAAHSGHVTSVLYNDTGNKIIAGSSNHVKIFDAESGEELVSHASTDGVSATAFFDDGLDEGDSEKTGIAWAGPAGVLHVRSQSSATSLKHGSIHGMNSGITSLVVARTREIRSFIAAGTTNGDVVIFDAGDYTPVNVIKTALNDPLFSLPKSLSFSPDGTDIAVGNSKSNDNRRSANAAVFSAQNGTLLRYEGNSYPGNDQRSGVAFDPDDSRRVAYTDGTTIAVWDARFAPTLLEHDDDTTSTAFSADGGSIVVGTKTGFSVWELPSDAPPSLSFSKTFNTPVNSVAFGLEGVVVVAYQNIVQLWNLNMENALWQVKHGKWETNPLPSSLNNVTSVAFSPDGKQIVSGSEDKTVMLWDVNLGSAATASFPKHEDIVTAVAFMPDGRILSASRNEALHEACVRVYKENGSLIRELTHLCPRVPDAGSVCARGMNSAISLATVSTTSCLVPELYAIGGITETDGVHVMSTGRKGARYGGTGGRWKSIAQMSHPRDNFAGAVVGGFLYVCGGHFGKTVERYNPVNDLWGNIKDMTTARMYHAAATAGGKLYAVGGSSYPMILKSGEYYDPETESWSDIAPMSTGRRSFVLCAYFPSESANSSLFAIGGAGDDDEYLKNGERYDRESKSWFPIEDMSVTRFDHAAATINGFVYVTGGTGETGKFLKTGEKYNINDNSWSPIASMPQERSNHSVSVLDGKLYVIGGIKKPDPSSVSVIYYDPDTNKWQAGDAIDVGVGNSGLLATTLTV
uniref:Pyrrolo-quinoline quinone repeat domain-containing protein n=1 Tax=viral metagenome TaxID=1070528 RepID=A0A6C0KBP8_9ZZZZ